jgi:hypothetical protein
MRVEAVVVRAGLFGGFVFSGAVTVRRAVLAGRIAVVRCAALAGGGVVVPGPVV